MKSKFLFVIICLFSTEALSKEIYGSYSAVTETEFVIELAVLKNSNANLKIEVLAVEDAEQGWVKLRNGRWSESSNKLTVIFETGEIIEYEIVGCLPYSEFGKEGCSYGLRPIQETISENDYLLKYGLWKIENLEKLWSN